MNLIDIVDKTFGMKIEIIPKILEPKPEKLDDFYNLGEYFDDFINATWWMGKEELNEEEEKWAFYIYDFKLNALFCNENEFNMVLYLLYYNIDSTGKTTVAVTGNNQFRYVTKLIKTCNEKFIKFQSEIADEFIKNYTDEQRRLDFEE